ncbi:histidinol-phosphate transaminase [Legionella nagasakiensis]|uniref:histidinol-phosphate transaminase n=1 Tax=Legionella nagasakiensis TaxID=535290 RepID=UPI0010563EA6|nr:histidinol-phosphate transaminase [Legionella nagasakiensis]
MSCDYHLLPHPGIQTLAPYIPGKSAEELAQEQGIKDIIKLASNENPLGCSPRVLEVLSNISGTRIATYPAAANHPLRHKLAEKLSIDSEMITLGNGSDVLFSLMMTCFALHRNKEILVHDQSFIAYRVFAKTLGIPVISTPLKPNWEVDIDAMIHACHEKTALIFIPNPNNPTGLLLEPAEIKKLLNHIPDSTILVLDEAYYEYVSHPEYQNSTTLLSEHPNLIITRTFSKAYGMAGLRLGYAIANKEITAILQRANPPFTVNQAALVAAIAALDDDEFIKKSVSMNQDGLNDLKHGLDNLGIGYLPTAGNFITMDCKTDAGPLYEALQRHGIIVRPLHPYGLNHYLRVTVGTEQQNHRFLDTLSTCLST